MESAPPQAARQATDAALALHFATDRHYAALAHWLTAVTGIRGGLAMAQLNAHRAWLNEELLRPGQRWHERLPVAVEASARWRTDGVQCERFIIGATTNAFAGNRFESLLNFGLRLRLPARVRWRLTEMLASQQVPAAVQIGLARTPWGWSRRLYLERGSLPVHMRALEWAMGEVRERTYVLHDPAALDVLGDIPPAVRDAWQALIADHAGHPGLLRRDDEGESVAIHVQMLRRPVQEQLPLLLRLADTLAIPRAPIDAWVASLPTDTELTVASLGRDGQLQMNVYVAPRQASLPQPGPPPGDIRATPGTVCWQVGLRGTDEWRGWLLFALPGSGIGLRPAASSPGVHVWTGSSVPDAVRLAGRLASAVATSAPTVAGRLASAETALQQILNDAGLAVFAVRETTPQSP